MKALLFKEARENVVAAALGLVIYALLLAAQYREYVTGFPQLSQPLAESSFAWSTQWFCIIFGAVLGWLQIHNERRPDLWAFLLHRPMTRTQIFLGKTLAGLAIYAIVVGAPLLVFIAWALWPGNVAAPFEWALLRPLAILLLAGVVFYFGGMLTGLRQARWYGSRALGLGLGLIVCLQLERRAEWWQALLTLTVGGGILAAAAWGAFQAHGYYRRQPILGKAALVFSLMAGGVIVAAIAAVLPVFLFSRGEANWSSTYYGMNNEGIVEKITQRHGVSAAEVVGMAGRTILEPQPARKVPVSDLNRRTAQSLPIELREDDPFRPLSWFRKDVSRVVEWQATSDALWYYWRRYGRLVGYDIATRRFIGSVGPDGFASNLTGHGDRFGNSLVWQGERVLWTPSTLYRPDLEQRALKPLFTTTSEDPIITASAIMIGNQDWKFTQVTTKRFIHLLTATGEPVWKAPYDSSSQLYARANIFLLNEPGQFALWMSPTHYDKEQQGWSAPLHVLWLARDQGVERSADVPGLPPSGRAHNPAETVLHAVAPPVALLAPAWFNPDMWRTPAPRELLLIAWGVAVIVCLPIGLWLGRRYRFTPAALVAWSAFLVLFGVPGLLAFLGAQEWPARVPCPACKRLRLVDRRQCEHCGADFAPAEKTGTEVFAPLEAGTANATSG